MIRVGRYPEGTRSHLVPGAAHVPTSCFLTPENLFALQKPIFEIVVSVPVDAYGFETPVVYGTPRHISRNIL